MLITDFEKTKGEFQKADVDKKIQMYISAEGLNSEQYKELLKLFPIDQLDRLEKAFE